MFKNCLTCNEHFYAPRKEINRGYGKYCSRKCSWENTQKKKIDNFKNLWVQVSCAYCFKEFKTPEYKLKRSRSRLYFCCRNHKDLAQRIEFGLKAIHPAHYANGDKTYRTIAFRNYQHKCADCNYDAVKDILVVHHIDEDRSNNDKSNLVILCPNCHALRHRKDLKAIGVTS